MDTAHFPVNGHTHAHMDSANWTQRVITKKKALSGEMHMWVQGGDGSR